MRFWDAFVHRLTHDIPIAFIWGGPKPPTCVAPVTLACIASVSARVRRRERWDESKKIFFGSRSNFRAITRLETLATQATVTCILGSQGILCFRFSPLSPPPPPPPVVSHLDASRILSWHHIFSRHNVIGSELKASSTESNIVRSTIASFDRVTTGTIVILLQVIRMFVA